MNRRIIIRPEAESELADACAWYEERRRGLGVDLLSSVEATLEAIRENPEAFPIIHRDVRRALIGRFPYGVFYTVKKDAIAVLAVFHARRAPEHWHTRS